METNKVPTAEEFGNSMYQLGTEPCKEFAIRMAKEFAKLHVKAALEAANKKVKLVDDKECWQNCSCQYPCKVVDKNSILNAYPKDLIR